MTSINKLTSKNVYIIFACAVAIRLFYVLIAGTHEPLVTDAKDYDNLGVQLSQWKGYVDSLGKPTAFRPPVYPLFLGVIYYVFGHNLIIVQLIQSLLGAGICLLVYFIAMIVSDRKVAGISAYVCCFYPPLVINTLEILSELLFTFFMLSGIWIILGKNRLINYILSGLLFGLALLTRPFIIFFFPLLAFWIVIKNKGNKGNAFKKVIIFFVTLLFVLVPWTLRNYYQLHSFIPLSNHGGLTLYNSYVVPDAGLSFNSLQGVGNEYYEIQDETGENRYLVKKTIEYIKANPINVVKITIKKVLLLFYPFDGYWYSISFGSKFNVFWGLVFCFSVIGFIVNLAKRNMDKNLIYLLLASFLINTIVFYGSPRFRLPMDPLLIYFASSGFLYLYQNGNIVIISFLFLVNGGLFVLFRYFSFQKLFEHLSIWMLST